MACVVAGGPKRARRVAMLGREMVRTAHIDRPLPELSGPRSATDDAGIGVNECLGVTIASSFGVSPAAAGEEIEQRPGNQGDVPAVGKALDQTE